MDEETFTECIKPKNLKNRESLYQKVVLDEMRWDLYLFLLSRDSEENYFDLSKYIEKVGDVEVFRADMNILENAGWKTALSFGDTGLFIYKGEKPKNCW
jgi:hypothetical protein